MSPEGFIGNLQIRMIPIKMTPEFADKLLVISRADLMPALTGDASRHVTSYSNHDKKQNPILL